MLKHLNSSIASRKLIAVLVVTMLMVAMACNGEEGPHRHQSGDRGHDGANGY